MIKHQPHVGKYLPYIEPMGFLHNKKITHYFERPFSERFCDSVRIEAGFVFWGVSVRPFQHLTVQ